jgi:glycosyltransferase involved in cell wall biosynthesis
MRGVTLVFPAYSVGLRFEQAVLSDDGSNDSTSRLIAEAAGTNPRITSIAGPHRGKGAAVRAGIGAATGELVLLVDVDLSTPLGDAGALLNGMQAQGARMAIGSRDMEGARVDAPLHRRIMGVGFNLAVRGLTGLRFHDTQSGFKLIETELARALVAEQIAPGFAFDVELLMRARLTGEPVVEVPVSYVHDDRTRVRVVRSSAEMSVDLVRLARRLRTRGRGVRPIRPPAGGPPA